LRFVGLLPTAKACADRLAHISSLIASGTSPESLHLRCRDSHLKTAGEVARG